MEVKTCSTLPLRSLLIKVGFVYPLPNDVDQSLLLKPFIQIRLDTEGQVITFDRLQVDELHRHIRHEFRWLLDVVRLTLSGDDVDLVLGGIIEADTLCDGPMFVGIAASEPQKLQAHGLDDLLDVVLSHEVLLAKIIYRVDDVLICVHEGLHGNFERVLDCSCNALLGDDPLL